jgi:hypothetical protein
MGEEETSRRFTLTSEFDPKRTCKCMLISALKIRRIDEGPGRSGPCSFHYMRWLNVVVTENMKHFLPFAIR